MKDSFTLALAFPLVDRYKNLIEKVEDFFTDNNIDFKVYFVDEYGAVIVNNMNKDKSKDNLSNLKLYLRVSVITEIEKKIILNTFYMR